MRQLIFYTFCIALLLTACQGKREGNERLISVTIEPERYIAEQIAGEFYQINCVIPDGQSPETYDPTPQEMILIGKSKAYLRIGDIGFEQAWMKAIKEQNPSMQIFDLSKGIHLIATQEPNEHAEAHAHHHGPTDPHIWTSAQNMKIIARNAAEAFITLDPENKKHYEENYTRLITQIERTKQELDNLLIPLKGQAFIIYHPALTYLARDYQLKQLCIEMDGKEPSPAQLKTLVETARKYQATTVFVQQEFDQKNAELIAKETGCRLIQINPLEYDWAKSMIHIAKSLAHGK